jgi:hypothetical protein
MLKQWNGKVKQYLRVVAPEEEKNPVVLLRAIAAVRSNLASACQWSEQGKDEMKKFAVCWEIWRKELMRLGHEVYPDKFGSIATPVGRVIATASPRAEEANHILVLPGLKSKGKLVAEPVTVSILPAKQSFPSAHVFNKLPFYWRGILAEMDLLLWQLEIQNSFVCGMEAIHKTEIVPFAKNHEKITREIERRQQSLVDAVVSKMSNYQLATNYSRVEECFWAIFHDDERPPGYSFFDIIRKRVQEWRPFVQRGHRIAVRDFIGKRDSLAAIHNYVNSMVLKKQTGVAPGIVLRQLRPALTVEENKVNRVLHGRVICT